MKRQIPSLDHEYCLGDTAPERDGYRLLVQAIILRAVDDAAGRCTPICTQPAAKHQGEARAWLREETGVIALLELAGYDSDKVLPRVRELTTTAKE
jgi:hypothetical protein